MCELLAVVILNYFPNKRDFFRPSKLLSFKMGENNGKVKAIFFSVLEGFFPSLLHIKSALRETSKQ